MKITERWLRRILLFGMLALAANILPPLALAQAGPTATQRFKLSAFGGGSGVVTDVFGGRNLSITAGADLSLRPYLFGWAPAIEIRGTYPVDSGTLAGLKSAEGGLRLQRDFGRLQVYGDVLFGRGQIDYQRGGYQSGKIRYLSSTSPVISPGIGVDYELSKHLAAKADFQYQLWTTYPLALPVLTPKVFTGGLVYRFDFNRPYEKRR
jgi:hypothetical protein